jgi:glycosyltransferase involved in cell wall biosynthesis
VAEQLAVRWSDALIADAPGIGTYYQQEFGATTEPIAYGAPEIAEARPGLVEQLGLEPDGYHLVVARFEPENHVREIVDGYSRSSARLPLVVVGSAPYADRYTQEVHAVADSRTRFLGGVWDQDLLDALYASSRTYVHGHSVGGTNPSLLRAVGAGAATIAFDVVFNRDVLGDQAWYFSDPDGVAAAIEAAEDDAELVRSRSTAARVIAAGYDWDDVARTYADLCERLVGPQGRRRRPSGRRSGAGDR